MDWNKKFKFSIGPRPWYEWVLAIIWLLIIVFLLQNALGSGAELQSEAATIFWVMTAVWFIIGVVAWFLRRPQDEADTATPEKRTETDPGTAQIST